MTQSRAKAIHDKVNSLLYTCELDPTLDGTLPHANALCILRYDPQAHLHGRMEAGHEDVREEGEEEKIPGPVGTKPGMVPGYIPAAPGPTGTAAGTVPGFIPAPPDPTGTAAGTVPGLVPGDPDALCYSATLPRY